MTTGDTTSNGRGLTSKIAMGVALGVLLALAIVYLVVQQTTPQDCPLQRTQVVTGEKSIYEIDEACR